MNIDKGKSSSVMRARQRTVVYWPTLNYQNVEQLSVEQIMLKSVDEAEEAEFEQTQVKFFDDLYSSIKNDSSFESNNNILNTVSSACEDACNHIADVACMNDADDHCTAGGVKVCVLDNCDVSKEAPFTSPMPSEKEGALISSETEFHETRGAYEVTENFSNIELRGQNALLHTQKNDCIVNCSLPSAQTAFDLANLRDSLPRLVITAPERLHDEVTGAFTLYSGIDTPRASLWSARLNFAASTMVAAQHSDDGESLDTSCCSIDSIVTASSIESGPRTFYDPALHRPTHLTGTVLAPVCNSGEIFKKPVCSSLTSVSAESQEQVLTSLSYY
jgi:hypothetical protein